MVPPACCRRSPLDTYCILEGDNSGTPFPAAAIGSSACHHRVKCQKLFAVALEYGINWWGQPGGPTLLLGHQNEQQRRVHAPI